MKIAMIGHKDFPSRSGGVEVVVYELSTRLAERGHKVTVYNRGRRRKNNHFFFKNVEVYRTFTLQRQSLNAFVYSVTATLRALFKKYDIIHYHALGPSVMLFAAKLFGKKTVATVHGLDWQRTKWNKFASRYLLLGEKIIAKYADEVIVLSENVRNYFMEKYNRKTVFIKNAVVPVRYSECNVTREKFGLSKDSYILYLARIVPEKGLHYLISAFLKCNTNKILVIAGEMPDSDYGRQIAQMAAGHKNIVFTGFADEAVISELYSNCSVYVLPSEIEGLALTLLEAMSAGARCLVSDIPENSAVLGGFGYYFKSGNAESLQRVLQDVLEREKDSALLEKQREYVKEQYNYDTVVEQTENVYGRAFGKA